MVVKFRHRGLKTLRSEKSIFLRKQNRLNSLRLREKLMNFKELNVTSERNKKNYEKKNCCYLSLGRIKNILSFAYDPKQTDLIDHGTNKMLT